MSKYVGAMDDDVMEMVGDYLRHIEQQGGALPHFYIEDGQHGEGLAEIVEAAQKFFNPLAPVLRSGVRALGRHALGALTRFAGNVASGSSWKEAARASATEEGRAMRDKLMRMAGQGGGGSNKNMRLACRVLSSSTGRVSKRRRRKKKKTGKKVTKRKAPKRRRKRRKSTAKGKTVARRRKRVQAGGDIDGWL
jgi:hypothetical protein